jgi:exonuclease SbcC
MTAPRLKTLVIENFRSLRGKVVVPLDAQVVLVHGSNGMGKTSVLSALELALTGKIAHLTSDGNGYQSYLTTLGTEGGSVGLTTTDAYTIQRWPRFLPRRRLSSMLRRNLRLCAQ